MDTIIRIIQIIGALLVLGVLLAAIRSRLWAIVIDALKTVWRHKYLVLVGIFPALVYGYAEFNVFFANLNPITTANNSLQDLREIIQGGKGGDLLGQLGDLYRLYPGQMLLYTLIALGIIAVFFWIVIVSQVVLIRVASHPEKVANRLFDGATVGTKKFWSAFNLNLIALLATLVGWVVLFAIPAIGYYLNNGSIHWMSTAGVGYFIIAVPVNVVVLFLLKYALAFNVLTDSDVLASIKNSWALFIKHWAATIEVAAMIMIFNVVLTTVCVSVIFLMLGSPVNAQIFITEIVLLVLIIGILMAFSYCAWTILFLRLRAGETGSQLGQWTSRLVNLLNAKKAA